ncbi:MAG TPA: SDR family NAD(P)-dependent oxidoreductase [Steroidobacteraceae bacterium]|nr:SDR family NAD(P)-dependent oxidoreductase [Steroidobacteraceae bacterium]
MQDFRSRVAFVTGAASGIGMGLARAFLAEGMRVAIADVRADALQAAADTLGKSGAKPLPITLDVTDRGAWSAAAERVTRELGPVELLCSNAGVNFVGATQEATFEDWQFCLGVNLGGAINAIRTFVPAMVERAGGHIVVTSSVSGLFTHGGSGCYATSKFALVGLAESLRADLAPHGVGVSVLCPGPVQSELFESTAAVRPAALAPTGSVPVIPPGVRREDTPIFSTALTADEVGRQVLRGIRRNDLYIMTHPEIRSVLEARCAALLSALPAEPVDPRRIAATSQLLDTSLYTEQARKPRPGQPV